MGVYEDTEKGLLEAVAIKKGEIEIVEKPGMPAKTFIVDKERRGQGYIECIQRKVVHE